MALFIAIGANMFTGMFLALGCGDVLTDIIVSVINIPISIKQALLEELDVHARAVKVFNILKKEVFRLRSESGLNPPRTTTTNEGERNPPKTIWKIINAKSKTPVFPNM